MSKEVFKFSVSCNSSQTGSEKLLVEMVVPAPRLVDGFQIPTLRHFFSAFGIGSELLRASGLRPLAVCLARRFAILIDQPKQTVRLKLSGFVNICGASNKKLSSGGCFFCKHNAN